MDNSLLCVGLLSSLALAFSSWGGAEDKLSQATELPLGLSSTSLSTVPARPAEVALGERLFSNPLLSSGRSVSCSSCHKPGHGFADTTAFSKGVGGRLTLRNTPTILNRALGRAFLWDGKAATCWRCHAGENFGSDEFHNTGIGADGSQPAEGRFAITGQEVDRGRCETPTLRALTLTAPYMHDGSLKSL